MQEEEKQVFKFECLGDLITPADLINNNFPGGKTRVYELFNAAEFPSFRLGKRFMVSKDAFVKWVEKRQSQG